MLKTYQISFRCCQTVDPLCFSNFFCCGASVNTCACKNDLVSNVLSIQAVDAELRGCTDSSQQHKSLFKTVPYHFIGWQLFIAVRFAIISSRIIAVISTVFSSVMRGIFFFSCRQQFLVPYLHYLMMCCLKGFVLFLFFFRIDMYKIKRTLGILLDCFTGFLICQR